ncbi:MAG TPA: hypothetical protein VGQ33_11440 [Vicinamibacteria bacterium]|nr:hypothetical protein [Vicinamibacteria bacterium]
MSWPCLGLRLLLLVAGATGEPEEKKPVPVPVYTNDDLDRVSPFRDETGVNSAVHAPLPSPPPAVGRHAAEAGRAKSEAYWRREAERLHERLRVAHDRIDLLRARIDERESQSPSRSRGRGRSAGGTDTQLEAWRRQLAALEARTRDEEARFEDRARREGALPGWLR